MMFLATLAQRPASSMEKVRSFAVPGPVEEKLFAVRKKFQRVAVYGKRARSRAVTCDCLVL